MIMTSDFDAIGLLPAARPDDLDTCDDATRGRVLERVRLAPGSPPVPRRAPAARRVRLAAIGGIAAALAVAAAARVTAGTGWDHGRPSAGPARTDSTASAILLAAHTAGPRSPGSMLSWSLDGQTACSQHRPPATASRSAAAGSARIRRTEATGAGVCAY
jgi:hypothetical protein